MRTAADIMMQQLKEYIEKFDILQTVVFVGYQDASTKEFATSLQRTFKNVG